MLRFKGCHPSEQIAGSPDALAQTGKLRNLRMVDKNVRIRTKRLDVVSRSGTLAVSQILRQFD